MGKELNANIFVKKGKAKLPFNYKIRPTYYTQPWNDYEPTGQH